MTEQSCKAQTELQLDGIQKPAKVFNCAARHRNLKWSTTLLSGGIGTRAAFAEVSTYPILSCPLAKPRRKESVQPLSLILKPNFRGRRPNSQRRKQKGAISSLSVASNDQTK